MTDGPGGPGVRDDGLVRRTPTRPSAGCAVVDAGAHCPAARVHIVIVRSAGVMDRNRVARGHRCGPLTLTTCRPTARLGVPATNAVEDRLHRLAPAALRSTPQHRKKIYIWEGLTRPLLHTSPLSPDSNGPKGRAIHRSSPSPLNPTMSGEGSLPQRIYFPQHLPLLQ